MEQGITLDPTSYLWGRQATVEAAPAMIESTVLGRQVTPAARVRPPLWVRRAGHGLDTFWVVGNSKPSVQETDLEIIVRYFNAAPILAAYYGGETAHAVTAETTVIKSLKLDPRSWAAFKTVALLDAPGSADAVSRFSGDALSLQLELAVSAPKGGKLLLTSFGPVYEVNALEINGKPVIFRAGEPLPLQTGANKVRASYSARSLRFSMDDWNAVELIKDGKTNFCLIADAGVAYNIPTGTGGTLSCRTGFEHGTARMLNDFIEQYDDEDGRMGNLEQAQYLKKKPDNFAGWTVTFTEQPDARPGRVLIDRAQREIRVEGAAQGEIRRAMVVLMRMVDRKYPHVGRFFPFRYHYGNYEEGKPIPLAKWIRKPSAEFFAGIPDPKFVIKPLLRKEYDDLYKNDNMDFAGKYSLRWSPYIFEPTYGDNFVYGYTGVAEGEPREELMRLARPLSAN
jgi:hypothetical protein